MRSRTFVYKLENPNFDYLQQIDCRYHLYGNQEGVTHGFISFLSAKSVKATETYIKYPVRISENTVHTINEIKLMTDIWEKGEPPKKGRSSKRTNETDLICRMLLKQNNDLMNMMKQDKELLIAQNQQLQETNTELNQTIQKQLIPLSSIVPPIQQTVNSNNIDNSKNKKITNIQLFLNTECKDAITLFDFVKTIEISDEDLECLKKHGYVESVTRLLKRALKPYDIYNRPIHCSDVKREILHVKDQEGWKKESPQGESTNIDKAFRHISHKQTRKVTDVYRDISNESPKYEEKTSVMYRVIQATNSEDEKSKKKILKNLADTVHV